MSVTSATLNLDVLRNLGRYSDTLAANATDTATVDAVITRQHAWLEAEGVAYWSLTAIPDAVADDLMAYISAVVAKRILGPAEAVPFEMQREDALMRIRRFTAKPNADVKACYF
jgi:hypothetical protein